MKKMRFRFEIGLLLLAIMLVIAWTPIAISKKRYPPCECGDPKCSGNLLSCPNDDCECYCTCGCSLPLDCPAKGENTECWNVPDDDCPDWPWTVDVLVVTDEEYRSWCNENSYNYTQRVIDNIENAAGYFLSECDINLTVVHVNNTFISDTTGNHTAFLIEVQEDLNWPQDDWGADILVLYTASPPGPLGGMAEDGLGDDAVVVSNQTEGWARGGLVQHEISHLFDCPDHDDSPEHNDVYCIMDSWDFWMDEERDWCSGTGGCIGIIDENADVVVNLHENR